LSSFLRIDPTKGERVAAYENFTGLDTTRSRLARDNGSSQSLDTLSGGYADEYGQIIRESGFTRLKMIDKSENYDEITHITLFNAADLEASWVYKTRLGLGLRSTRLHETDEVWPSNAVVSSTVFNGIQLFVARALQPYTYDQFRFEPTSEGSNLTAYTPAFCTTVQNRVIIAGIPYRPTEIHFSRTNELVFYDAEIDQDSEAVTRPGFIDIQNLIPRAENITGLAQFEISRLAIFTENRMIMYQTDPDIEKWTIDASANVNVGCLSHNTIVSAGTDVIFCSRNGIHSISRSRQNGIMVFSTSLSDRVQRLYKQLVRSVDDPQKISAVWDQDNSHYHVFFPNETTGLTQRLTLSLNPSNERTNPKFSLTQFLNGCCGYALSDKVVIGTIDGPYVVDTEESETSEEQAPLKFSTPLLFHGSITNQKMTRAITIQAAGKGHMRVTAFNQDDKEIWSDSFWVENSGDDGIIADVPLFDQFERPFEAQYRAVRFEFEVTEGQGEFFFSGFGIHVKR
jgi:predicted Fe-Mo cluster-binding NifX family protein